jgi:ATP-dependent protease HslVU (ClpYQ) peptidase subunit
VTTIVATLDAMGADTMVSRPDGSFYPTTKIVRVKGDLLGAAGDAGDCTRFMDWAKHDYAEKKRPKFSVAAGDRDEAVLLILNSEGLFTMSTTDPYPELITSDCYAIGSGGDAARAAILCGKTMEEALAVAALIDMHTRGPFTILKLKG